MHSVPCASGSFSLEKKLSGPLLQVSAQGRGWADCLPVLIGAWLGGRGGGERVEGATRRGQPRGLQGSASHSSQCLSFLVPGEHRGEEGVCPPPALFFLFQESFLSGFKVESQHLSLSYIPNNQNCEEGSPIRGSGMICFLFVFSSFCPYTPFLVLEEGAGLTRPPEGFGLPCLRAGPHLDHTMGLVVALGGEWAFTCVAGPGRGEPGGEGLAPTPDAWPEGAVATTLLPFSQGLSSRPGTQSRQSRAGRAIVARPLPGRVTPASSTPSRQARISGNSFGKGGWGCFLGALRPWCRSSLEWLQAF